MMDRIKQENKKSSHKNSKHEKDMTKAKDAALIQNPFKNDK